MQFLNNLGKFIVGTLIAVGTFFAPHAQAPSQNLAASFNPVQTQVFQIAGGGITNVATSVLLTNMQYSNGTQVTMADLGSIGFATIEPGVPKKEEQVSFTGIIQQSNGEALLTGVTRGLAFNPGTNTCNGSSTLGVAHAGSVNFVLSNTACFYQQFAILANTSSFSGSVTFSNAPTVLAPSTNASSVATYGQLASTSFAGTVNGSQSQKGIFQEATQNQLLLGTPIGSTGADLVVPAKYVSFIASSSGEVIPVTFGTIDPSFLNLGSFNLLNTVTASVISASTTLNGTTTVTGTFTINGISPLFPSGAMRLIASSSLTSAASVISVSVPSSTTFLYVQEFQSGGSSGLPASTTFNGDAGNDYSIRYNNDGGGQNVVTSTTGFGITNGVTTPISLQFSIDNSSTTSKIGGFTQTATNGISATSTLDYLQGVSAWATSTAVTSITFTKTGGATFNAGSYIYVFGY